VNTQGYLPDFWTGRSAIFFANLLSMFFGNEQESRLLAREVRGAESYGGRLVPLLGLLFPGGRNVLVLERRPDAALCAYFGDELDLPLPEIRVLSHQDYLAVGRALAAGTTGPQPWLDELRLVPAGFLDGFVTDDTLVSLAAWLGKRTIATNAGSHRGNNKLLLHQHLERAGLPVFDTRLAETPAEVARAVADLRADGYDRMVVKAPVGASGVGMVTLAPGVEPAQAVPAFFFFEGPCLVQGWMRPGVHGVESVRSPSVQLFLNEDTVYLYDLTEQILGNESVHHGNESPPPYTEAYPGLLAELFRQAGAASTWLHDQGYRGTASVDFLVTVRADPADWQVYVCEINARVTGATYPSVLARHYRPQGAWLMRNLQLATPLAGDTVLGLIRAHADLFQPTKARGVLPINFNTNADNLVEKGQFLCLGDSSEECRDMLRRVEVDLPIDWEYVRD
jgi:hypothetical protein